MPEKKTNQDAKPVEEEQNVHDLQIVIPPIVFPPINIQNLVIPPLPPVQLDLIAPNLNVPMPIPNILLKESRKFDLESVLEKGFFSDSLKKLLQEIPFNPDDLRWKIKTDNTDGVYYVDPEGEISTSLPTPTFPS